jgi:hypothetical protein
MIIASAAMRIDNFKDFPSERRGKANGRAVPIVRIYSTNRPSGDHLNASATKNPLRPLGRIDKFKDVSRRPAPPQCRLHKGSKRGKSRFFKRFAGVVQW